SPRKLPVKSARCARVAGAMTLRATPDWDLPRQRPGIYQEDGRRPASNSAIAESTALDISHVYKKSSYSSASQEILFPIKRDVQPSILMQRLPTKAITSSSWRPSVETSSDSSSAAKFR